MTLPSPRTEPLRVAVVGCGRMGGKRATALGGDRLVAAYDVRAERARALASAHGAAHSESLDELLGSKPDVVVVATRHDKLAGLSCRALEAGAHVLVEKPAGMGVGEIDTVDDAARRAGRLVKVGFNHRFHPGIARAVAEVRSGRFGPLMFTRALYGHGGRLGYEQEWRARRELSGGGELVDQGMHLLDLSFWLGGPLPLDSALLRTSFWNMDVEDNAVLLLGEHHDRDAPWAMLHASWSEWKNMFSLEVYCRTAKLHVTGLAGSYGPQSLRVYRMSEEMGPPELEEHLYPPEDGSWRAEWEHFASAVRGDRSQELLGDLASARYAWSCIERAYEAAGWEAARA